MRNVYLIIGRSGTGKSTVTEMLANEHGLCAVASYTTRPPRYDNEPGHTFITKKEFDELTMVAYTNFNGYEYGVTADMIDRANLYVIDIAGVEFLQEKYHGKPVKTVFLSCPRDLLKDRMLDRGDPIEKVQSRLENDDIMFAKADVFPFDIVIDASQSAQKVADDLYEYIVKTETNDAA